MKDNKVTIFPNGITTSEKGSSFDGINLLDPIKVHKYFNDFDTYNASDWTVTKVGAATEALADEDGGILLITNAAAGSDSSFSQKVGESFLAEAGKKLWYRTRFKVSDAIESILVSGLQITDATPLDATDGIYLRKDDGDAELDLVVVKDSVEVVEENIATLVSDTYIDVCIVFDGVNKVSIYVNDVLVKIISITEFPDDEVLTISYGIQNGEAVAKSMSIDYVFAAKER